MAAFRSGFAAAAGLLVAVLLTGCFGVRPLRPGGWLEALSPGRVSEIDLTATYHQYRPAKVVHAVLTDPEAIDRLVSAIDALSLAPSGPEACGSLAFEITADFVYSRGRRIHVAFVPACARVVVGGHDYAQSDAWRTLLAVVSKARPPLCVAAEVLRPCGSSR